MTGSFKNKLRTIRRYQDIEKELPQRIRKEPKPGDNPLKRPYPPHARDIEVLDELLEDVPRELPSEFSERDLRTITRPQGVLYFHVLDIQDIKLSAKDFVSGAPVCVYLEYECQGTVKCSYPVYSHKSNKIRIDHFVHFSAQVSEIRSDEANDLVIHVYAFQNPEKHWLIGSQLLHVYNFIRDIHGISSADIQDDLSYFSGTVTFEFAWAYGAYGFGHSNQLRNTKNPVYDSVCHSLFPRIAPSTDDLIDNKFRVRVPKRLRMITLYSLMVRVPVLDKEERMQAKQNKKEAAEQSKKKRGSIVQEEKFPEPKQKKQRPDYNREAKNLIFRRVKYARGRPVHVGLSLDIHQKFMESDFNHSYGEYICLRNRRERLEHLTRMVEGRLRDRYEAEDAVELFHPILDPKDCRTILSTKKPMACPPGYVDHVIHACTPQQQQPFQAHQDHRHKENDEFVEGITSAPRFSGYLAKVFGYANPPDLKKTPLEKHEYYVKPNAFLGGGENELETMTWSEKFRYKAKRFWYSTVLHLKNIWEYIFPSASLRVEMEIPEISVTLPSPADSATEFYAHCVQEKIYPKVEPLTATKRQAINLVRICRRKNIDEDDESEDEDGEKWDIEGVWDDILAQRRKVPNQFMNAVGRDVRRAKDVRPLEHVEAAKFGHQHTRPKFNQAPW